MEPPSKSPKARSGAVTQRELAQRLGLGKSTVQRALAGSSKVDAATRERVLATAAELGYQHDLYFAALSARRHRHGQHTLLLHYLHGTPESPFISGRYIARELQRMAGDFGFEVKAVDFAEFPRIERIPRILYQRGTSGIIVGHCDPRMHPGLLALRHTPVLCNQRQDELPFHTVRFGISGRFRLCWEKLRAAGYRRIGFAVMRHEPPIQDDHDRLGNALAFLQELQESERIPPFTGRFLDEEGYLEWVQRYRPEAIIGFNNRFQWSPLHRGLPDIPLVSLHAWETGDPDPTPGTHEDKDILARAALKQMDSMIRHGDVGLPQRPVTTVLEPVWYEGDGIPAKVHG